MNNMQIASAIISILCFIPAIVCHEVAHGWMAHKLGDPTAERAGRLSLNPLKHIDPFGTVILPLMLLLMGGVVFGYAKPVPYDPRYFKNLKQGEIMTGLAGPCANLLLGFIGAAICWGGTIWYGAATGFAQQVAYWLFYFGYYFTLVNFFLMFFNLIPIPPLDGSSLIVAFLPQKAMPTWYKIQRYSMPILMILLIVVPMVFPSIDPIGWYMNATAYNLASLILPV